MRKSTVLIVDDDKDIREIIEIYLMNENIDFISAKDGIDALEKLENNKVDLILLDIMMPSLAGIKACLKIRTDNKCNCIFGNYNAYFYSC